MKFRIALYQSDEGFAVQALGLPGCWSQGETRDEALENIADAIRGYLDVASTDDAGAEIAELELAA